MGRTTWIKLYSESWLRGSIRKETCEIRSVFVDLLTMAGDSAYGDIGTIQLADGVGFSDDLIAGMLNIPPNVWLKAKKRFASHPDTKENRIEIIKLKQGYAIKIINWVKYQSEYERQKPYRKQKKENDEKSAENGQSYTKSYKEIEIEKKKEMEIEKRSLVYIITCLFDRFMDLYKKIYNQARPQSKSGKKEKKIICEFYRQFDNPVLWVGYSQSQYEHCLKLINLFFENGPQKKWSLTPRNLCEKADRLQRILTTGDDGVYDAEKARQQQEKDEELFNKIIADLSKSGGIEKDVKALHKLPEHLHGRLRNLFQRTWPKEGAEAYRSAKAKYEQEKKNKSLGNK